MPTIDIKYDDRQVQAALTRLLATGNDLNPVMKVIAGHLEAGVEQSFARQTAPDSTAWAKLKPSTVKRRRKKGKGATPILEQSGQLLQSITSDYDATSAVVGTNLVYATTHQFGAKKGEFGSYILQRAIGGRRLRGGLAVLSARQGNAKTVPIPWGDIPARPFLGVSDADRGNILDIINSHLAQQWK